MADSIPSGTTSAQAPLSNTDWKDVGPKPGIVRKPRAWFIIDGVKIEPLDVEVSNNAFFSADTFRAKFRIEETGDASLKKWADQEDVDVQIFFTDGTITKEILRGRTDDVDIDLDARLVLISGRDLTAELIETKTSEKWQNKTSSEIARIIAGKHDLTPVVDDTTELVGTYYAGEKVTLADETTEWNLLTYLAEKEGFVLFVVGRELHFEKPTDQRQTPRWVVRYRPPTQSSPPTSNTEFLRLRRNLTVARDVVVKVITWNSKEKRSNQVTARADRSRRPQPRTSSPTRTFVYRVPNLTNQQQVDLANQKLKEVSQAERVLDTRLAADLRVQADHIVTLVGTGTGFDIEYLIDAVTWDLTPTTGFTMRIQARNIAPTSQVAI